MHIGRPTDPEQVPLFAEPVVCPSCGAVGPQFCVHDYRLATDQIERLSKRPRGCLSILAREASAAA